MPRAGLVPGRVDQHEPRLVVVVRAQRRVVGRADVDRGSGTGRGRRPRGRRPRRTRRRSRLGEQHVVVRGGRARPRRASSSTKPDSDGVARAERAAAPRRRCGAQQVGRRAGAASALATTTSAGSDRAVGQPRRRRPARRARDDLGAPRSPVRTVDAQRDGPLAQRVGEPAQAAAHVPGAEGLLDVRHGGQRGRRAARVGAGVGRVAVEQRAQPRVAQVRRAEPAQRAPRRDGAQVAGTPGQPQQVAARSAATRGTAPRVTSQIRSARSRKRRPLRAGAGAERGVEGAAAPAAGRRAGRARVPSAKR